MRTIVDIISSGALPPKKGTANGVSACLFFWALAHFSEQSNLRSNFGRHEMDPPPVGRVPVGCG